MLSRQECFKILQLDSSAGPNAIKQAYRKLAFELHPDLNPDLPNASKRFQELNEAYVLLMQEYANTSYGARAKSANHDGAAGHKAEADEKTRAEANRAYQKAKGSFDGESGAGGGAKSTASGGRSAQYTRPPNREEILQELLNDPFARRVFEDIYSHVRHGSSKAPGQAAKPKSKPKPSKAMARPPRKAKPKIKPAGTPMLIAAGNKMGTKVKDLAGGVKTWLRKQIDDEQIMFLPGESLYPGARIRLQVKHGFSDKARTIEFTLPPEFQPGRPIRLKGLGKHVGNLKGDLYLRVFDQDDDEEES